MDGIIEELLKEDEANKLITDIKHLKLDATTVIIEIVTGPHKQ
jgi:hypothetical protein